MRVHALQPDPVWEDHGASRVRIQQLLEAVRPNPGDIVVLPELSEVGFTLNSAIAARDDSLGWGSGLARNYQIWLQLGVARRESSGGVSNTATIFDPGGNEVGVYRKVFLFSPSGEDKAYEAGRGPVVVDCDGIRIAPMICYDLRFPELWRRATLMGAELFTIGACWPTVRQHHWHAMLRARAIENQAWVAASNRTGKELKSDCFGGSCIVDHDGATRAHEGSCVGCASTELDIEAARAWRKKLAVLSDIRGEFLGASSPTN